ncbi:MAG: lipid carrier--UDP-N-acetylgalactosaminyltransferase [Legionellales bacterium]|nr:lipid carrier--UDP-N-acetylgalactosaminyltransferase [Legionellales bacterium]|tara:strand:+ start:399 stop:1085 length:687 start_codon:yes stop_codon:yes gene_type:complete
MERLFDIFFALVALVVLSPFLIPIAIVLRVTGEGEVFFLQSRIGRYGERFQLLKFATMLKDSPNLGSRTVTVKNDPRVLPLGKLLRKTKINELPQIINILKGDMSLIGPRPLTDETFNYYTAEVQKVVRDVRPGLSGVGSIVFRGEEDMISGEQRAQEFYQEIIAPYKGLLESWFAVNRRLDRYFILIFLTIEVVFRPKSRLIWRVFKDLPSPPIELRDDLDYPSLSG